MLTRAERNRYRTLVDRLLGMRLTPVMRIANRNVSYEFMNRQMVWHAFTVGLFLLHHPNVTDYCYRSSSCSSFPSSTPANSNDPPETLCRNCASFRFSPGRCAQRTMRVTLLAKGGMPPLPRASVRFASRTRRHCCLSTLRCPPTPTH